MKKYTVLLLLVIGSVCFAQKRITIKLGFNKLESRFKGNINISGEPINTFFIIRTSRIELYKEVSIKINENLFLFPAFGFEYKYNTEKIKPRARLDLRGNFDKMFFKVTYGSDLYIHGVSTRLEHKLTDKFWIGIQTHNELIGPRIDWRFCALNGKNFKLGAHYLSKNKYGVSLRFDIFDIFPDLKDKKNNIEKWMDEKLNPFN